MYDAFLYIVANDGIDTASSYPFKGKVGYRHKAEYTVPYIRVHWYCFLHTYTRVCIPQQMSCSYTRSGCGATMSGSVSIKSGSESDLQSAVANIGPISVAVDARSSGFRVSTC